MKAEDLLKQRSSQIAPALRQVTFTDSDLVVEFCEAAGNEILRFTVRNPREWHLAPAGKGRSGRFAVLEEHPLLLNHGPTASIFGQAPLPDPYRFLLEFHRLVRDTLAIERDPVRYLNWGNSVSDWLGFVYSRSYNLLSAPVPVANGAKELLDAQMADTIVLPDRNSGAAVTLKLLLFGDSWVIGEDITAEH